MRRIPERKSWQDSLAVYRQAADDLPEGAEKMQMLAKVANLERAIILISGTSRQKSG
jgi:hypothetical protein